jgi:hypothetical protein
VRRIADLREWRTRDVVDSGAHKIGSLEAIPGYVKVNSTKSRVKGSPAIGTDDVLPFEDEEAVFQHDGLPYEPGASAERQLAHR